MKLKTFFAEASNKHTHLFTKMTSFITIFFQTLVLKYIARESFSLSEITIHKGKTYDQAKTSIVRKNISKTFFLIYHNVQ